MKSLWMSACWTLAAVLALLIGERRVEEAVALDPDNLASTR